MLSHLTAGSVAGRMGVGRSAIYRMWDSESSMWADAIDHMLAWADEPVAGVDGQDGWPALFDRVQAAMLGDHTIPLRNALLAYNRPPELDRLLDWRIRQTIDALAEHLQRVLAGLGREPTALSVEDMAMALFCVANGLAYAGSLTDRLAHRRVPVADGVHGLLAYAVEAVLVRCTQPGTACPRYVPDRRERPTLKALSARQVGLLGAVESLFRDALVRDDDATPVAHLTIQRLARLSSVSRQAVQSIWSSQRAFGLDLMRYLHRQENEQLLGAARRALREATVNRRGASAATDNALERLRGAAAETSLAHLAFTPHMGNPDIRAVAGSERERTLDTFAADLQAVTDHLARSVGHQVQLREGITYFDLAALMLVTETSVVGLQRIAPDLNAHRLTHNDGDASPVAIVVEAVLAHTMQLPSQYLEPSAPAARA